MRWWKRGREDTEEPVADQKGGYCGDGSDAIFSEKTENEATVQLYETG